MVKIPSALKWMMNRRARLLGEIKKVEKRFEARESALQKELNRVESRAQTPRSRLLRVADELSGLIIERMQITAFKTKLLP